jgi:hypothetical protein
MSNKGSVRLCCALHFTAATFRLCLQAPVVVVVDVVFGNGVVVADDDTPETPLISKN